MDVKKAQAVALTNANRKKFAVGLISFFILVGAIAYSHHATATTNVSGVEIEILNESVASNLVGDPVQNFLADIDNGNPQDDLWARIKDGYAMSNLESAYTTKHETWYASRPEYIKRMVDRGQRYLFHIVEEVQKRGMPTEIALLPMIESAFNPQANSSSRASGIWQFIPSTGKHFGLQQNWWVDNRRDVTAATNAALDYLQKLHGMFGTWELALAAYNAGEGTVQRAIDRNRRKGLPTDYQSLDLPAETENYVPKLQAIKNIVTDPEKFGLNIGSIPNRPYFARVTTPKQIDAKLAAQLAEISYEEFSSLNPSYNRPVITSTGEKHQLLLPVWAAERFADNLANYDKPLTSWQTYHAKRGERMDHIANKFGINVSQLRDVNDLSASNKLRTSQAMLVPASYKEQSAYPDTPAVEAQAIDASDMDSNETLTVANKDAPKATQRVSHKVKKGETLQALANRYDVSAQSLMKINQLRNSKLRVGQNLTIKDSGYRTAHYKERKVASSTKHKKLSSHRSTTRNNHKSSRRISARSHLRLK